MSSNDSDKIRLVEEHYQSFWHGNLDDFDQQLSPDFVDESAPPGARQGPLGVKEWAAVARSVFSPMAVTIDDAMVADNVVVVHARWRGRQVVEFMGRQPADGDITFGGIVVWQFGDDGRIARRTAFFDPQTAMTVVPA